jgi:hypothetical protein
LSAPERGTAAGVPRRALLQAAAAGAAALHWPVAVPPAMAAVGARALLVGNTSYNPRDEDLPPARKCIADLQARLQRLGFEVVTMHDAKVEQVQEELERLQRAVAADTATACVFYFVGHGFQSNAENFLVPAGGDLGASPAQLAKTCLSLERHVFTRLRRDAGPAATVILVDACRTPDRPRSPTEGYNQTMPPEGCHVAFATGPGKRAFAPNDPQRLTLFADVLVAELEAIEPTRSVQLTLESVKVKVAKRVNSIETIVRAFGRNAQEPELASNVSGDPAWVAAAGAPPAAAAPAPASDAVPAAASAPAAATTPEAARAELERLRTLAPEPAIDGLKRLLAAQPGEDVADIAQLRLNDLEKVLSAARTARLNLDIAAFSAGLPPRLAEDAQRAVRGDKYAALRVAESLPPPAAGELVERTDQGRWMSFAAYLGNGIAAYRLSLHFRNVDRRDAEASRYLNLARANQYTPPRQLDTGR